MRPLRIAGLIVVLCSAAAVGAYFLVPSNIDPDHKFSWGENVGWMNWRDANGGSDGVFVDDEFLSGYIWTENAGWLNVGDGNGPYANTDNTNFGVNIDTNDELYGFAWGENIGWINFEGGALADPPNAARFDYTAGRFRGYAWGENVGWINLDDATHYVAAIIPSDIVWDSDPLSPDRTTRSLRADRARHGYRVAGAGCHQSDRRRFAASRSAESAAVPARELLDVRYRHARYVRGRYDRPQLQRAPLLQRR